MLDYIYDTRIVSLTMHQRRDYRDDEMVSSGLRVSGKLLRKIHEAAEKAKYRSTSGWLLDVVIDAVAKQLGVDPADLTLADRYRGASKPGADPETAKQIAALNAIVADVQARLRGLGVDPPQQEAASTAPAKSRRR